MKRCSLLFVCLLLMTSSVAAQRSLRVRLWSQHQLRSVHVSGDSTLQVRTCRSCAGLQASSFSIQASGSSLAVNGSPVARLFVSGNAVLQTDTHPVHLARPLELTVKDGFVAITADIPLEDYVAAVLTGEGGGIRSPEALKALAVAIRTYAVHFRPRHAAQGFDFCDSTHCQDLRLAAVNERIRSAVAATQGELLWYDGSTIAAYYHQDCGGMTNAGSEDLSTHKPHLPYLIQHADPWCVRRGFAQWETRVRKYDLALALRQAGLQTPANLRSVRVGSRSTSGRVLTLEVSGEFSKPITEDVFYTAVGRSLGWARLRSALYDVSDRGDEVVFTGHGNGHGVGLCQAGASVMADEGHTYREILAFYYPGTELGINAKGLRWSTLASDRLDLQTVHPEADRLSLQRAEVLLRDAEARSGLTLDHHPTIRLYPTVAAFRDATGEPGWVAASTRGNTVHLEPTSILQRTQSADRVLRHELLHLIVESNSRSDLPLWFREGMVLWLNGDAGSAAVPNLTTEEIERILRSPSSQQELRTGYSAARSRVAMIAKRYGKAAAIAMLHNGLPPEVR